MYQTALFEDVGGKCGGERKLMKKQSNELPTWKLWKPMCMKVRMYKNDLSACLRMFVRPLYGMCGNLAVVLDTANSQTLPLGNSNFITLQDPPPTGKLTTSRKFLW